MRCTQNVESGAYVLGALAPAERATYERHLATCPDCRAEVGVLACMPGLLGRLDAQTAVGIADPVPAPPALLTRVVAEIGRSRARMVRRRRWQTVGAAFAAACLAALAALGVTTAVRPQHATTTPLAMVVAQMKPINPNVPISAVLGYAARNGGTQIQMRCLYDDPDAEGRSWTLALAVVPRDGSAARTLDTWPAVNDVPDDITARTDLAPSEIAQFELLLGDTVLMTYQTA